MTTPDLMTLGRPETVHIDEIKPYWRNPRRVTEEEVNKLVESIRRFGYQQPIVVDEQNVIIVGHTRYAALRRMDVEQVPVRVATDLTPAQVKAFRLIDNRVAELTSWDFDKLAAEIEDMDLGVASMFFPEMTGTQMDLVSDAAVLEREWGRVETGVDMVCPTCFHSFHVDVTREQVMSGTIDPRTTQEQGATA